MILKTMGVMNLTPNSFSDGGEISSTNLLDKIQFFNQFDAMDVGAESTAPMNKAITAEEEWERLKDFVHYLPNIKTTLSIDTYHPETAFKLLEIYSGEIFWNDVSGKADGYVREFLAKRENCHYIFCHNLAPKREMTIQHMNYLSPSYGEDLIEEMVEFFSPHIHPRIIFDPCLGFSKDYEQNWFVLENFSELQRKISHDRWLIGFSRKSFLRKKYQIDLTSRDELDQIYVEELKKILSGPRGEIWIRTHRPELLALI
jgi:dihydropteroate synthase